MLLNFHQTLSRVAIATLGTALPLSLLPAAASAFTVDFTDNQPPIITNTFTQNGVMVTGSNDLFIGQSEAVDLLFPDDPFVVAETNGIGVVGGNVSGAFFPEVVFNSDAFVDSGEFVSFAFDSIVSDVLLTLFPGSTIDLDNTFSDPGTVEAFGAGGSSLGIANVTDTTFDVSSAFNDQNLSGFRFVAASDIGTSISSVSAVKVPTPSATTGIIAFSINAIRKRRKEANQE